MESVLRHIRVRDIRELIVKKPSTITGEGTMDMLLMKFMENPLTRHVYVVGKGEKLLGSIRLNLVIEHVMPYISIKHPGLEEGRRFDFLTAMDIMNPNPPFVEDDTLLAEVIEIMKQAIVNELPVIDQDRHIIGEVNSLEVIAGYLKSKGKLPLG